MREYNGSILHSPSDLVRYLGCSHATALEQLRVLDPENALERAEDDAMAKLVQEAGLAHEDNYRAALAQASELIEIPKTGSLEVRAQLTRDAMQAGVETIFQATFLEEPWHGFADFLIRVEEESVLGGWSYEPVDTKLARSAKASHIVQLGIYARMIANVQGTHPRRVHVQLGDGRRDTFRMTDFDKTLTAAVHRYLVFVGAGAPGTEPEPCAACPLCPWRGHCGKLWEEEDHLSLVCGLGKPQAQKLRESGITNGAALASAPEGMRIPRMAPATFAKLRAQAILQQARKEGTEPVVETLPVENGRGFSSLPQPNPADLFFDLEGDPLEEGGLDYLWGVHYRDGGKPDFRFRWGHDHQAERIAFEDTLDWMVDHLQANPSAHIYHYAPYEITSLRRLSTLHASREGALDELLRQRRFIDLYAVLRQAVRTSEPNLSLKTMEIFFADAREGNVTKADQSIIEYKNWKMTGDQATLHGILEYNKVDCENTEALRNWLVGLRKEGLPWRSVGPAAVEKEGKSEGREEAEAAARALIKAIEVVPLPEHEDGRALVGYLTQFHRRADKPAFWEMFDRCEREPEELIDDGDCIGDIGPHRDGDGIWQAPIKRSVEARYRFLAQESKLREGSAVLHAPSLMRMGTITSLDCDAGTVSVKRGLKGGEAFPENGSLIPEPVVSTAILAAAVRRVAECWANGGQLEQDGTPRYRAILDLIGREKPRLSTGESGPLVRDGESFVEAATFRCLALDRSSLFIQGPPGTGKTYTSAHTIVALLAAGKKVGVSSNSHKAINNLLSKVEDIAETEGVSFLGVKKANRNNPDSALDGRMITDVYNNVEVFQLKPDLIGGTAWLFADKEMDQDLDYLFIDEAGQVSLGHLLAMGAAAKNIVLVGDQMQLAQPIQGSHPGESGLSALDYLLQGEATVAPDAGILLDTSWRMHPDICEFISDAVYDGRLKAHPDCAKQQLHLKSGHDPALATTGLRFVAMDHEGCGQRSDAETARAKELAHGLIGTPFTARDGTQGTIGWENIEVARFVCTVIGKR